MVEEIEGSFHAEPASAGSMQLWKKSIGYIQDSAYWRTEQPLMRGRGQKINSKRFYIDVQRSQGLHSIYAAKNSPFMTMAGDGGNVVAKAGRKLDEAQAD